MAAIRSIGLATKATSDANGTRMYAYLSLTSAIPATKFRAIFEQHPDIIKYDGVSVLVAEKPEGIDGKQHIIEFSLIATTKTGVFIGDLSVSLLTVHDELLACGSVSIAVVI